MRRIVPIVAACIALAVMPGSAAPAPAASERPSRLVCVGSDAFAPYQYLDFAGEPRGFNVDLMRALACETGIDIEVRLVKASMSRYMVERGDAGAP